LVASERIGKQMYNHGLLQGKVQLRAYTSADYNIGRGCS